MSTTDKAPTYADFVRRLFNVSGDPSKDLAHVLLGIATEIHELRAAKDSINALEELGDLRFYVAATFQVIGDYSKCSGGTPLDDEQLREIANQSFMDVMDHMTNPEGSDWVIDCYVNDLLDHAKRWVGYGKAPTDTTLSSIAVTAMSAASLAQFECEFPAAQNASREKLESMNMAKLLKRYPGGEFDSFRAINRDLENERESLEQSSLD